jgi:hypothetical protein
LNNFSYGGKTNSDLDQNLLTIIHFVLMVKTMNNKGFNGIFDIGIKIAGNK